MNTTVTNPVKTFSLIAFGLAIAAMGIYVANADDAPGAAIAHANTSALALRVGDAFAQHTP